MRQYCMDVVSFGFMVAICTSKLRFRRESTMYKNHEGYPDPAAGAAIHEADRPPEDYRKAVRMMLFTAKCMGYHVEDTIRLRDEKTGRLWP